jgi:DNA repair protein RadC
VQPDRQGCLSYEAHAVIFFRAGVITPCFSREVFRPAIKDAAKAILLVHNHPSGDPTPSADDLTLTTRLEEVGKTVGIQVLDHIIVARGGAASIREYGS